MKYSELVRPEVLTQPVYEPGKPIESVAREYGLRPESIVKLASNENPLGPSPLGLAAARKALESSHLYPDGGTFALRQRLADHFELEPSQFIIGNGSNEIMAMLGQAMIEPGDEVVVGEHAFVAFTIAMLVAGAKPVKVPMPGLRHDLDALRAAVTERTKLVYLPAPNNPTGDIHRFADIARLVEALPEHVLFFFDEAYAEYLDDPVDLRPLIAEGRKVLCCRTFSKIYGLASERIGYAYGATDLIELLQRVRQPFNVNAIAQAAARAALDDQAHVARTRAANRQGLQQFRQGFASLELEYVPTEANFILLPVPDDKAVFQALQERGVITRPLSGWGLPGWLRVSVGLERENSTFLTAISEIREVQPQLLASVPSMEAIN